MPRSTLPVVIVVVAALALALGCGPATSSAGPSTAVAAPRMELRIAPTDPSNAIPDAGTFVTDPSATVNTCVRLADGFWKVDYSGGDPYVRINLLVGPEAVEGGPSDAVSAEIVIGSPLTTLLNFDQPGYRSGDRPGRSTATVETTNEADAITFKVAATTPRAKVDFSDYPYALDVDLTASCPTEC
jgi:hypothetical protein